MAFRGVALLKKYTVKGMSCAACAARVERAVSSLEAVSACSVNLLTNTLVLEGDVSDSLVRAAVESAGYGIVGGEVSGGNSEKKMLSRLIASIALVLVLMYFSMGAMMWGFPLPAFLDTNAIAIGAIQLVISSLVILINRRFFISGAKAVLHRSANMDTLVALGSGVSYLWSIYVYVGAVLIQLGGDVSAAMHALHGLYFESAAMILALISLGKLLEGRAKGKTTNALRALMDLSPKLATLLRDGEEITVMAAELSVGDVILIRPGESIPADAVVISGESAVDESSLTGESMPSEKTVGSQLFAGTVNRSGVLRAKATEVGAQTALSQIIKTVSDATSTKAPIAKVADKVSAIFVPSVIAVAIVTFAVWLLINGDLPHALERAISVLVISCPCSLGLATPVAIMVGSGVGARSGILFKSAAALEMAGRISTVALDKTGTVTAGAPSVTDIVADDGEALLRLAASLEVGSEHPLARAVVDFARERGASLFEVEEFSAVTGCGVYAKVDGKAAVGGKLSFIKEHAVIDEKLEKSAESLTRAAKTPLFFALDGKVLGVIAVADTLREDTATAVERLKAMNLQVVMLTGDNSAVAEKIAESAGIEKVKAELLPNDKAAAVESLAREGRVMMVGDGINDAPALARADLGCAIGRGTDVAIDSADLVLMRSNVGDIPAAIALGRCVLRNIRENLFWAFIYNAVGIPLAAGVFTAFTGWELTPMFGAAAMSLSSFSVVMNALRLNFAKIYPKPEKEKIKMKKTMKIEGMMCPHCEGRVKKALEALAEVKEALVSHESGTAAITLSAPISDEKLTATVTAAGYDVLGIE